MESFHDFKFWCFFFVYAPRKQQGPCWRTNTNSQELPVQVYTNFVPRIWQASSLIGLIIRSASSFLDELYSSRGLFEQPSVFQKILSQFKCQIRFKKYSTYYCSFHNYLHWLGRCPHGNLGMMEDEMLPLISELTVWLPKDSCEE